MGAFKELSIGIEETLKESKIDGRPLTKGEVFVLKWQYGLHGHFFTALVQAICKADTANRTRLMRGFPQEVKAMNKYFHTGGWWDKLEERAKAQGWGPFKPLKGEEEEYGQATE